MNCGAELATGRPSPDQGYGQDPYRQDPYQQQDPYRQDPYRQDPYRQDPYRQDQGQQDPYRQDPYRQDPYQQDPYRQQQGGYGQEPQPDPYAPNRADTPFLPQSAPGPGPARLILESGLGKIEYPLDAPVVTIGRSRSNDISLEDSRVSRHHARIVRDGRGFLIEDLNSRNGTRVDDRAVRDSTTLTDGAVVRIGDSVFRFTVAPPSPQQGLPPPGPSPFGGGGGYGGPGGGYGGPGGGPGGMPAPQVFVSPRGPVQCPSCQGLKTMRPIVYPPASHTPEVQAAARRGEVSLGEGPPRPDGPNAECRACETRVRLINPGG